MTIPDYQTIMLPLLKVASDGGMHSIAGTIGILAQQFRLTEKEVETLIPSGNQSAFSNKAHWAKTYLAQAGLLEVPRRGQFRITQRGKECFGKRTGED